MGYLGTPPVHRNRVATGKGIWGSKYMPGTFVEFSPPVCLVIFLKCPKCTHLLCYFGIYFWLQSWEHMIVPLFKRGNWGSGTCLIHLVNCDLELKLNLFLKLNNGNSSLHARRTLACSASQQILDKPCYYHHGPSWWRKSVKSRRAE